MTAETRYTIAELVERTGIPATTIHHYRNAGLLPPPERVGANRFRYSDRHVQALRLIRVLRDRRRLPLPAIREVLPELLASGDEEAFHTETWEAALTGRPGVPDATRGRIVDAAVELVVGGVVDALRAAADKAGGQLDPPAAMVALVMSARPGFMLLLELTGGSLRGQPGHRELADRAFACFVDGVGPLLTGPGTARERTIALIVELARQTMRAVLGGG